MFRSLLTLLLFTGLTAQAQQVDSTIALQEITITATRQPLSVADAPTRVTFVSRPAIEGSSSRSVADLLARQAGVFVRQYGRGLATVSMRGSSASQTLVLLDGLRLSDPQLGQIDLSLLPSSLIESVEVSHGGRSSLYGSDGMGGAVNLTPRTLDGTPYRVEAAAGMSRTSRQFVNALLQKRLGAFRLLASIDLERDPGEFHYADPFTDTHEDKLRTGADRIQQSFLARIEHVGDASTTSLGGWVTSAERGLPGPVTLTSRNERQWDHTARIWLRRHQALGKGQLSAAGYYHNGRLRYVHPELQIDNTGHTNTGFFEATVDQPIGPHWTVIAGASGGISMAAHPSLADEATEQRAAAFTSASGTLGRVHLYPALRLDTYFTTAGETVTALSPTIGLNLRIDAQDRFRLKASSGRAFRMPTLNDRFWQPGGNPGLVPEQGWTHQAGLLFTTHPKRWHGRLEATAFLHQTHNQIVWAPTDLTFWAPDNVGEVRARGIEGSGTLTFPVVPEHRLRLNANYTFTEATDRTDPENRSFGHQLRYTPRHQYAVQLAFQVPHFWVYQVAESGSLYFDLEVHGAGQRYITTDGSSSLPGYRVVNLQIRRHFERPALTLAMAVENLFREPYQVIKGYPMPSTAFRFHLGVRLPAAND